MSRLKIGIGGRTFLMNVLEFSSPTYQTIASAQTKTKAVHFPIKVNQPDVHFSVIFSSEADFERFQMAIRYHQQLALGTNRLLTLSWPERDINNWTGVVKTFKAGGARRNYAPRAELVVQLVDSLASERVEFASVGTPWQTVYGGIGMVDAVLDLPSQLLDQWLSQNFGTSNLLENGVASVPYWWPQ